MEKAPSRLVVTMVALVTTGILVLFDQFDLVPAALVATAAAHLVLREPALHPGEDDELHLPPDDVTWWTSRDDPAA